MSSRNCVLRSVEQGNIEKGTRYFLKLRTPDHRASRHHVSTRGGVRLPVVRATFLFCLLHRLIWRGYSLFHPDHNKHQDTSPTRPLDHSTTRQLDNSTTRGALHKDPFAPPLTVVTTSIIIHPKYDIPPSTPHRPCRPEQPALRGVAPSSNLTMRKSQTPPSRSRSKKKTTHLPRHDRRPESRAAAEGKPRWPLTALPLLPS